jgi:hypothetical protein
MIRLALVMGKQGSGKTTRVCAGVRKRAGLWNLLHWLRLRPGRIEVRPNHFNHITGDGNGGLVFVTGDHLGKRPEPVADLRNSSYVFEFPHSGYIPPDCNPRLNNERVRAMIFAIELPEAEWRAIPAPTRLITSPEYFMEHGPVIVPRSECDYRADTALIREGIARSGVPARFFASAETMFDPIRDFLLG